MIFGFESSRYNYADAVQIYSSLSDSDIEVLGKSQDGEYNIHGITIGDSSKPTFGLQASIHGNEWQSVNAILAIIEILENPSDFPEIENEINNLKEKYQFKIIPILNPYGYFNGQRRNSRNVDLNRNYDSFSESESRISRDFFNDGKISYFIDMHTWPLGAGAVGHGGYWGSIDDKEDWVFLYHWAIETKKTLELEEQLTLYRPGNSGYIPDDSYPAYRFIMENYPDSLSTLIEASRVKTNQEMVDYLVNGVLLQILMWDEFITLDETPMMRLAGTMA